MEYYTCFVSSREIDTSQWNEHLQIPQAFWVVGQDTIAQKIQNQAKERPNRWVLFRIEKWMYRMTIHTCIRPHISMIRERYTFIYISTVLFPILSVWHQCKKQKEHFSGCWTGQRSTAVQTQPDVLRKKENDAFFVEWIQYLDSTKEASHLPSLGWQVPLLSRMLLPTWM
jgi:hypothetical protein